MELSYLVRFRFFLLCLVSLAAIPFALNAQAPAAGKRPLIPGPVDPPQRRRLAGNTRAEAILANDAGAAPGDLALEHMMLQLRRAPEQEQALEQRIAELHNASSPNFHKWLTPAEFAATYGPA